MPNDKKFANLTLYSLHIQRKYSLVTFLDRRPPNDMAEFSDIFIAGWFKASQPWIALQCTIKLTYCKTIPNHKKINFV